MSALRQNTSDGAPRHFRPVAGSLLLICNIFWALVVFSGPLEMVIAPHLGWQPSAHVAAPFLVLLGASIIAASIGTFRGKHWLRTALLVLLTIAGGVQIWESVAYCASLSRFWSEMGSNAWEGIGRMTFDAWWTATIGIRGILWVGLNYWYFLRSRSKTATVPIELGKE